VLSGGIVGIQSDTIIVSRYGYIQSNTGFEGRYPYPDLSQENYSYSDTKHRRVSVSYFAPKRKPRQPLRLTQVVNYDRDLPAKVGHEIAFAS